MTITGTEQPGVLTQEPLFVSGQYSPEKLWWKNGFASIHVENGTRHQVLELLKLLSPVDQSRLTLSSDQTVAMQADTFFDLLEQFQEPKAPVQKMIKLDENLKLFIRIQRWAFQIVRNYDVLAFAGLADMGTDQLVEEFLKLAYSGDEGWVQSGGMKNHVAAWVPALTDTYAQALRRLYITSADDYLKDSWNSRLPWKRDKHGQVIVDHWLCYCVDRFIQKCSVEIQQEDSDETSGSGFRIPYRGEQELIEAWQKGLGQKEKQPFSADRWLIWRMLKHTFSESGWKASTVTDTSGAGTCHLEMELLPPAANSSVSEWKLIWYIAHNHWPHRVPLSQWWEQEKRVIWIGHERLDRPDSWFLPLLRQAGEFSHLIERTLQQPAPAEVVIPPTELMPLIYDDLPKIAGLGVEFKYPDIETLETNDVRIRVQVKRAKSKGAQRGRQQSARTESWFDAQQIVDFDWTVVLGETEISRDEFQRMVEEQSPYIQLGGSWRLVPIQEIFEQLKSFQQFTQPESAQTNLLQFSRTVSLSNESPIDVEVEYESDAIVVKRWIEALRSAANPPKLPEPMGFHGELRHYQMLGFSWLIHLRKMGLGGCLADDMGLGKTIQILAYLMYLKEENQARGVHLLVCPTSLLQNWRSELTRFTPELRVHVHHGSARNNPQEDGILPLELAVPKVDLVMTTYATVVRDRELLSHFEWDALVVDEAQNIKNADTKQATAVRELSAFHSIALTGTPIENRLEELWSIMEFLNVGYLGNRSWFRRQFVSQVSHEPKGQAARRLQLLLQPVLLRRRKTDPSIQVELPEKWEVREYTGLTAEQAALYQSIVGQLWSGISSAASAMSRRGQILAALVRLKQLCDHPCLIAGGSNTVQRSAKLKILLDLVSDVVEEDEGALIFTQFRDMGELICEALEQRFGWKPRFLHGGLSASVRGEIVSAFQSRKDPSPVLVLSLKAGGVGLNLTRANHVFHFDRWWNPAVEDQATDRAFRIGQTKDVQVHKLVCSGTLEERIDKLITAKRTLSQAVVGESEGWITELNDGQLQSLFALDMESALEEDD
ncbi:DEAD/DEAH box helicase [Alicyclobacillus sp. SO9]|uniref:DEAD/DEAH box helicase n=1 Tax=Alicyclobacillus sp. SO9 TaxID=2665646 RepID=UPI0018E74E19|nr:DEAD/DEAH box helicase [Alicyclobacillus sp. SO9]QQE80333.1 DEAD/DEAH box helicase [Alicyclobacillus sp. SO9]